MSKSTQDKYIRHTKISINSKPKENEIRVTVKGVASQYIKRGMLLLNEKGFTEILIKATGNAIPTACIASEILKRRKKGLHQINSISSTDVENEFEPTEEGLDTVILTKKLSVFQIKLTLNPTQSEINDSGYQEPLNEDEIQESYENEGRDIGNNYRRIRSRGSRVRYRGRGSSWRGSSSSGRGGRWFNTRYRYRRYRRWGTNWRTRATRSRFRGGYSSTATMRGRGRYRRGSGEWIQRGQENRRYRFNKYDEEKGQEGEEYQGYQGYQGYRGYQGYEGHEGHEGHEENETHERERGRIWNVRRPERFSRRPFRTGERGMYRGDRWSGRVERGGYRGDRGGYRGDRSEYRERREEDEYEHEEKVEQVEQGENEGNVENIENVEREERVERVEWNDRGSRGRFIRGERGERGRGFGQVRYRGRGEGRRPRGYFNNFENGQHDYEAKKDQGQQDSNDSK